jgi:hypothetical protein
VRVDPIEQFGAKMLDGRLLLTVAHVRVLISLLVFFCITCAETKTGPRAPSSELVEFKCLGRGGNQLGADAEGVPAATTTSWARLGARLREFASGPMRLLVADAPAGAHTPT